jgi:hypothetical protein
MRFGFDPDGYLRDIVTLIVLFFAMLLVAFLFMKYFVRERR